MRSVVGVEEKGIREGGKGGKYLQASKMQMSKSRHWRFGWDMLGIGFFSVDPTDALSQSEPQFRTREISVINKFQCPFRAPNYSRNTTLYNTIRYHVIQ
jgi:hypothetical protein